MESFFGTRFSSTLPSVCLVLIEENLQNAVCEVYLDWVHFDYVEVLVYKFVGFSADLVFYRLDE